MFTKTKILVWLVAILLVTNISTIVSFVYHSNKEQAPVRTVQSTEIPGEQRTRFFKEELNLSPQQVESFRTVNRNFNQHARQITSQLEYLRKSLVEEMVLDHSDQARLQRLSEQIGEQHTQLKTVTYQFYLDMEALCNAEQKEKLAAIFKSLIAADQDIRLPKGKRGKGRWK